MALTPLLLLGFLCLYARLRGCDVYQALLDGADKGLRLTLELMPALVLLFALIHTLRASGLGEYLVDLAAAARLGIPRRRGCCCCCARSPAAPPGAAAELIARFGADSLIGRCAAVMLGSSETTFYVVRSISPPPVCAAAAGPSPRRSAPIWPALSPRPGSAAFSGAET